jgi:hypothetical protein
LLKSVTEITQLLRNRTAYDVYKYLEELISRPDSEGYTSNQVISTLNASTNHLPSSLYQYALPTNGEHPKSAHNDHKSYDKPHDKPL